MSVCVFVPGDQRDRQGRQIACTPHASGQEGLSGRSLQNQKGLPVYLTKGHPPLPLV